MNRPLLWTLQVPAKPPVQTLTQARRVSEGKLQIPGNPPVEASPEQQQKPPTPAPKRSAENPRQPRRAQQLLPVNGSQYRNRAPSGSPDFYTQFRMVQGIEIKAAAHVKPEFVHGVFSDRSPNGQSVQGSANGRSPRDGKTAEPRLGHGPDHRGLAQSP